MTDVKSRTVREAVGFFHSAEGLQRAIDELFQSGFHRAELGLLASEHAVDEKLGHRYRKVSSLEDDPAHLVGVHAVFAGVTISPAVFLARGEKAISDHDVLAVPPRCRS